MRVWGRDFIRFTGEKFKAYADGKGDNLVLCTPVIFDDGVHCGIGVVVGNEVLRWGLFAPRDYVASWRAGVILSALGVITPATVRGAFFAASRSINTKEEEYYTTPVIEGIGYETYNDIMSRVVPEDVVRAILDGRKRLELMPNLYPLTEEVEAGTLAWREEFSRTGVLTPEEHRAKMRRYEEMMLETDDHLYSIIDIIDVEPVGIGVFEIRNILTSLFEKGANKKHPSYILVALATVMGSSTIAHMTNFAILQMLERICQWISRASGYPRFNPFNVLPKKEGALSPQEASDLLQELLHQYFPEEKKLMGF